MTCPYDPKNPNANNRLFLTMCHRNRSRNGFSLIELMVVLALMGIMSGIAAPNFWKLFTKTLEQQDLNKFTDQLEKLRLEAWKTGRGIQLPKEGGKKWPPLPTGWQTEKLPTLRFLATGITNGGQILLSSAANNRWQIDIQALDGRITLTPLYAAPKPTE